jgi:hypothetical protein
MAYARATAYHETARTMEPIAELGQGPGAVYGVACVLNLPAPNLTIGSLQSLFYAD